MANSTPRRPKKRNRTSKHKASDAIANGTPTFLGLPFELIAEILIYTACPRDVLAVARCNKYLCTTLLRADSAFIWRATRQSCLPSPLPDPQPIRLSESAFAALVFDPGECIACHKITTVMYASWSLRVRLCSSACKATWPQSHVRRVTDFDALQRNTRKTLEWIPLAESPACFWPNEDPRLMWPDANKVYFISDMKAALDEYSRDNATVVDQRHKAERDRAVNKMSFYVELHRWKLERLTLEREVRKQNEDFGKDLAVKEGYEHSSLLGASPTYNALFAHRNKNLELLTRQDYDLAAAQIDEELIYVQGRGERRTDESSTATNRNEVQRHYDRLITETPHSKSAPLPSFSVFCTLPIVDLLQMSSAPPGTSKKTNVRGVEQELTESNTRIKQMLTADLARWRKVAEEALGAGLGFPQWKTARTNRLHPVARVTGRWKCGTCDKVARAYRWDECLDFEGVCKHECGGVKGKRKKGESNWKVEQFIKDEKAINAMNKLVELCSVNSEDPGSFRALEAIGPRILCQSCPGAIFMRPSNVVGHCHRHEDMKISLLPQSDADALVVAPIEEGLASKVLGYPEDLKAKREQETWVYGCRHCHVRPPPPDPEPRAEPAPIQADAPASVDADADANPGAAEQTDAIEGKGDAAKKPGVQTQTKQPKRFKLNGLRSHLKEKHSIELPNDEDMYRISS
ncbi:hypothetical protein FB45DRAFT_909894 [Roridomyces roridus]|uniref:F-box domain-containing protein n=1 Tax=Roridomyces roridus TaxID=1738132 RepID=A0AAD7BZA8_9AGAR|nr:hypothetical protein FB45DRAFT_909894 [Roridomyces roridus]